MYRILIVDDLPSIHEDYRKILGAASVTAAAVNKAAAELFDDEPAPVWEGFEVDSAYQGSEALTLVKRAIQEGRPYSVAFIDIRMPPGSDGIQTIKRMWEVDPEILVVIASAYTDYSWEDMVAALGRSDRYLILKKPFDNIEVRQCAMALSERWNVSRTDTVSGLLNRRAFESYLKLEWNRAERHHIHLACVMVDLDYFKRVNDTFGHQAGDRVIRTASQLLRDNCRASDHVCRYGGEEFCALLPHTDEEGAVRWARHARETIEAATVPCGDQQITFTASFGASARLGGGDSPSALVDRADQALLVAKQSGRNRVVRFSNAHDPSKSGVLALRRASLFRGVTASQLMSTPFASVPLASSVGAAVELMLRYRVTTLPVLDLQGSLAGIVSEKDVIGVMFNEDAWATPIEKIMQRNVVTYAPDTAVWTICDFLGRVAVRHVVIVEHGKPQGIVSRGSLLRYYRNWVASHTPGFSTPGVHRATGRGDLFSRSELVAQVAARLPGEIMAGGEVPQPAALETMARLEELVSDLLTSSRPACHEGVGAASAVFMSPYPAPPGAVPSP